MVDIRTSRSGRFRPILTLVLAVVVLVLGWVGLEVYFAYSAKPNLTVDYAPMINAHAESVQGEGPNEWDAFVEVLETHQELTLNFIAGGGEYDRVVLQTELGGSWLYPDPAIVEPNRRMLEGYSEHAASAGIPVQAAEQQLLVASGLYRRWLIEKFDAVCWDSIQELRVARYAVQAYPDNEPVSGSVMEQLGFARSLLRTLRARMILAYIQEDYELYGEIFDAEMAVGWFVGVQPTLTEKLVSQSIRFIAMSEMAQAADEGRLPDHVLRQALVSLERWRLPSRMYTIEGERIVVLDELQRMYDQRGRRILGGEFTESEFDFSTSSYDTSSALKNIRSVFLARHRSAVSTVETFFAELRLYANRPLWEQIEYFGMPSIEQMIEDMKKDDISGSFALIASLKLYVMEDFKTTNCKISIGLALYRNAHGRLPESLEELTPRFLESVPVDPLSRKGDLFVYKPGTWIRADGEPGGEYILYSVGFDGVDDGGTAPDGPMSGSITVEGAGTDYILNDPMWR